VARRGYLFCGRLPSAGLSERAAGAAVEGRIFSPSSSTMSWMACRRCSSLPRHVAGADVGSAAEPGDRALNLPCWCSHSRSRWRR
jgi:hypothetical protein